MTENLKKVTASRDELNEESAECMRAEEEVRKLDSKLEQRVIQSTAQLKASTEGMSGSKENLERAPSYILRFHELA